MSRRSSSRSSRGRRASPSTRPTPPALAGTASRRCSPTSCCSSRSTVTYQLTYYGHTDYGYTYDATETASSAIPRIYHACACACACACTDRKLGRPSELWHCALPGLVEGDEGDEGDGGAAAPPRRSFEVRALVLLEEQLPEARRHRRPLYYYCPPAQPPQRPFYCTCRRATVGSRGRAAGRC